MAGSASTRVHPTAILSPETVLGDGVLVGPYVITEGPVTIGPGSVVRPRAYLIGPLTLGANNDIGHGVVLGERPQHLREPGDGTRTEIGDGNIFREYVTVHRGTRSSGRTALGSNNFLMANAHVGHDCTIGSHCVLVNSALLGGHCVLGDRALISGNASLHQHVRVGKLGLLSGGSASTMDIPPFIIYQGVNTVAGVNNIGMQRAGYSYQEIAAIRRAYHILYQSNLLLPVACERCEQELGQFDAIRELVGFIRLSKRGVCGAHRSRAA